MRPICGLLFLFVLLVLPSRAWAAPPAVTADAAILMDARTGQVLYEKGGYRRRAPASTTKIVTAMLALQHGNLSKVIQVRREAASTPGSSMHLTTGQRFTLADLLDGLLMRSGNDASVAIAQAVAGSVPAFVRQMNGLARQVGAFNSHFENPNGLPSPAHYSTAYDLARIARAAMEDPRFAALVGSQQRRVQELGSKQERLLSNTNRLLWSFPGADGVKTGTTRAAGQCLVSSASRNGWRLIAVVLHSDDRWSDSAQLLNWGFASFTPVRLVPADVPVATLPVRGGSRARVALLAASPLTVVVPRAQAQDVSLHLRTPAAVPAPIQVGEPLGVAYVDVQGKLLERVPLVAREAVGKATLLQRFLAFLASTATHLI